MAREPSVSSPGACRAASARRRRRDAALASLAVLICFLALRRAPLFQPIFNFLFRALFGRFVVPLLRAQVILRDEVARVIVRVLVTFAVAKPFGPGVMRITQMLGHCESPAGANIVKRCVNGSNARVALRSGRDINSGFGNWDARLRPAYEFGGLVGGIRQHQ